MQHLTLYELNIMLRDLVALSFPDEWWVTAEISEFRQTANGHCYLELVDKDERSAGDFRAKARANIWRSASALLLPKFREDTGRSLSAGMKVLVRVRIAFHEVYGHSLTITDLDPTYTLGDVARQRQEILAQLEDDGVLTLNQELPLSRPLRRIAVISAAGAAGFGDFVQQLVQSGYSFTTQLFEATMQGSAVESSIIAALNRIAAQQEAWDCVVIIRGGGAVSDLNGFETYSLAANVAQFPLPILTGIGHERDETVIDLVAHSRFKTPTAVAAFLIEQMAEEADVLNALAQRLAAGVHSILQREGRRYERLLHRYGQAHTHYIHQQQTLLQHYAQGLQRGVWERLFQTEYRLTQQNTRLQHTCLHRLEQQEHRLERWATLLQASSPDRILAQGYSLTLLPDGRALRCAADAPPGTHLLTRLGDGVVQSLVES